MKKHTLLLLAVLILGLFLRLYGIEGGLPSENYFQSYKSDENIYLRSLSQMNPAKLDFNTHFFVYGAWHFYELGLTLKVAEGLGLLSLKHDREYFYRHPREFGKLYRVGRSLSVFYAVLTIWLLFIIGQRIGGAALGLWAALFLAVMPAAVVNSHYLKADASVSFWVTLLLLFLMQIFQSGRTRDYVFSGLALAFAAGAQQNGFAFAPAIFLTHLLKLFREGTGKGFWKGIFRKEIFLAYGTFLIVYLLTNPYVLLAFNELRGEWGQWFGEWGKGQNPFSGDAEIRYNIFWDTLGALAVGMSWPFVILMLLSLLFFILRPRWEGGIILLWGLPYGTYMVVTAMLATRYQMLLSGGVCLLIAVMAWQVLKFLSARGWRFARLSVALCLLFACFYSAGYAFAYNLVLASEPIQEKASRWLLAHLAPGTTIGSLERPYIEKVPSIVHQDYYYPARDFWTPTFRVLVADDDPQKLIALNPEYFVTSSREGFGEIFDAPRDWRFKHPEFNRELLSRYEVIAIFQNEMRLGPLRFPVTRFCNMDWRIPFDVFYVLKRRERIKEDPKENL